MVTAPERLLLRLEWTVVRRLDGRLQGDHRTVHRGSGIDFTGSRAYVDGDDARYIDWNVAGRLARRRALIVVLSDFIGEGDWERSLQRLVRRHEVVALRIVDTADHVLPEAGLIVVEDAETGEQLVVDSADPLLRVRFRA